MRFNLIFYHCDLWFVKEEENVNCYFYRTNMATSYRGQIEFCFLLNALVRFVGEQLKGNRWRRRRPMPRRLLRTWKKSSSPSTKGLLKLRYSFPFLLPSPIGVSSRFSSSRIVLIRLCFFFFLDFFSNRWGKNSIFWPTLVIYFFGKHGSDSLFFPHDMICLSHI